MRPLLLNLVILTLLPLSVSATSYQVGKVHFNCKLGHFDLASVGEIDGISVDLVAEKDLRVQCRAKGNHQVYASSEADATRQIKDKFCEYKKGGSWGLFIKGTPIELTPDSGQAIADLLDGAVQSIKVTCIGDTIETGLNSTTKFCDLTVTCP